MKYDLREINRLNFCGCGCGEYAKHGNRFITGHNGRKNPKPIPNHHLCGCNKCDILVASDKIYAIGHSRKGKHCSEEHKRNLSKPRSEEAKKNMRVPKTEQGRLNIKAGANKPEVRAFRSQSATNSWLNPEMREKKLQSRAITNALPEIKTKHKQSCIEAQNRPEVKEANRQAQLIAQNKPETQQKRSKSLKITMNKPEVKVKHKQSCIEAQNKPEVKARSVQSGKDNWRNPEYREKQITIRNKPESKAKRSEVQKNLWQDPEYRKNQLIAIGNGCQIKPNRPETLIDLITHEYWIGWKYTGDFSYWVNGKNPDFVNEEQKLIIEVYGDYWHRGEDPTDRAEIFAQAGYETCVIWESELNNLDNVIYKLRRFCSMEF